MCQPTATGLNVNYGPQIGPNLAGRVARLIYNGVDLIEEALLGRGVEQT